jgi:uncharacterized protein
MDIRSITLFTEWPQQPANLASFLAAARHAFPFPVQSLRAATPPFPGWFPARQPNAAADFSRELSAQAQAAGIDYLSLGPVQLTHDETWLSLIPAIINSADNLFVTAEIADVNGRLATHRAFQLARIIQQVSVLQANGFGNLYLAALAHCPPGSPFFPVAYHRGGPAHFAIAVESADLALTAVQQSRTLAEARANLVAAIEEAARAISGPAADLAQQFGVPFSGIDFSLAPFPTAAKSLGGALEALGLPHLGSAGSLFAAGFITEAIDRAQFARCGFSGLMLPVLEDSVLAARAAQGVLTVQDLLSYAAVCGVGLDTIPLPGDIGSDVLAGILLDVAMLASRLRKPLTARLMPLPGLAAGDPVTFDFPYFADSRVMAAGSAGPNGLLAQPALLDIQAKNR